MLRTKLMLDRLYWKQKGCCHICDRALPRYLFCEIDHIRPKKHGGTDDFRNLGLACVPCNVRKAARSLSNTRQDRPDRIDRIDRLMAGYKAGQRPPCLR